MEFDGQAGSQKARGGFFLALLLSLQLVCAAAHSADKIRLAVPDVGGQLLNVSRDAPLSELFDSTLLRQV